MAETNLVLEMSETVRAFFFTAEDVISLFLVVFLQGLCSASTVSLPESLLFVSTLDGNLHAVSKKSGSIKWTLKEGERTRHVHTLVLSS